MLAVTDSYALSRTRSMKPSSPFSSHPTTLPPTAETETTLKIPLRLHPRWYNTRRHPHQKAPAVLPMPTTPRGVLTCSGDQPRTA